MGHNTHIKLIFIALMLTLLNNCASNRSMTAMPLCRHTAVYHAMVYADIYRVPTRVIVGPVKDPNSNQYHMQGQAFINGHWMYLAQRPGFREVTTSTEPDGWYIPTREMSVEAAIEGIWYEILHNRKGK